MKTCGKCKTLKSFDEFTKKHTSKDGLNWSCRDCSRNYTRSHYLNNKIYYKKKSSVNRKLIRTWFDDYKSKLKCDCGENHPATFDFHHNDPSMKEDCISNLVKKGNLKKLQEELEKCKVMCSNCHRKFHFKHS